MPMIEIARAQTKEEALAGLERWKSRHADVWPLLGDADVLVDSMRGRSSLWYRIRLNLRNVAEDQRPAQEPLEVDYDPFEGWAEPSRRRVVAEPRPPVGRVSFASGYCAALARLLAYRMAFLGSFQRNMVHILWPKAKAALPRERRSYE
jgi:hypothetical protein